MSLPFWPTTWGRLIPADIVKAPDGSEWTVGASIEHDGTTEYLIEHPTRGAVWTTRAADEPVSAARPPAGDADIEAAIGALRLGGFDVKVISSST